MPQSISDRGPSASSRALCRHTSIVEAGENAEEALDCQPVRHCERLDFGAATAPLVHTPAVHCRHSLMVCNEHSPLIALKSDMHQCCVATRCGMRIQVGSQRASNHSVAGTFEGDNVLLEGKSSVKEGFQKQDS
jgi:hypothetical protein